MVPNAVRELDMSGEVRNRSRRLSRWIHQEIDAYTGAKVNDLIVGSKPIVGLGYGCHARRDAAVVHIFKSDEPESRFADAGATLTSLYVSR